MNRMLSILGVTIFLCLNIAHAKPINYTFSGKATGNVDGVVFSNAEVTITADADTDNVLFDGYNVFYVVPSSAKVAIAGIGSGALTRKITVFNLQAYNYSFAGVQQDYMDIVTVEGLELELYDLKASFGPLPYGYISTAGSLAVPTTMGTVVFNSSGEFTFQADLMDTGNNDSDNDGVPDPDDDCEDTPDDEVVNDAGCSVNQLCPCARPANGNKWKNHGAYVRCIALISGYYVSSGLLNDSEKDDLVSEAGRSECGHKK